MPKILGGLCDVQSDSLMSKLVYVIEQHYLNETRQFRAQIRTLYSISNVSSQFDSNCVLQNSYDLDSKAIPVH